MRRGKRKKKKLLSATGVFAAASAEADSTEDQLKQQQQQFEEARKKKLQQEPQLLPTNEAIVAGRVRRGGPPVVRAGPKATPILRAGVAPGLRGRGSLEGSGAADGKIVVNEGGKDAGEGAGDGGKPSSKRRKMDAMLNEMKAREKREALVKAIGAETSKQVDESVDMSTSTNIAVKNLSPVVTEEILLRELGKSVGVKVQVYKDVMDWTVAKFGPVVSIQILWPEDTRSRQANSGFVAFQNRESAEKALKELNNMSLYDYDLSLDWGEPLAGVEQLNPLNKDEETDNLVIKPDSIPEYVDYMPPNAQTVQIRRPRSLMLLQRIERTAEYVATDGCSFESLLLEREQRRKDFFWLFDLDSDEHVYYKWRVLCNVMGEKKESWRNKPFRYFDFEAVWYIPPPPFTKEEEQKLKQLKELQLERHQQNVSLSKHKYMTGAARERRIHSAHMDQQALHRFHELLDNVGLERNSVLHVMGFCFDYAEFATDCAKALVDSLLVDCQKSPISPSLLVARLYVLSDVLHNTNAAVKNASAYRNELQPHLARIFQNLNALYRGAAGRMSASNIKSRVNKVLSAWHSWMLLSPMFVQGLEITFLYHDRIDEVIQDLDAEKTASLESFKAKLNDLEQEALEAKCKLCGIPFLDREREILIKSVAYLELESSLKKVKAAAQLVTSQRKEEAEEADQLIDIIPADTPTITTKSTAGTDNAVDNAESDIDGESLDESDLDGEPLDSDDEI